MNRNPLEPGHYAPANQMLLHKEREGIEALAEKWRDEASEAAIQGKPERAGYIEHMIERLLGRA